MREKIGRLEVRTLNFKRFACEKFKRVFVGVSRDLEEEPYDEIFEV